MEMIHTGEFVPLLKLSHTAKKMRQQRHGSVTTGAAKLLIKEPCF